MHIRQLELTDRAAFMAFNQALLAEKESNPFIETKEIVDFEVYQTKLRQQETVVADPDWSTVTTYFAFVDGAIAGKISCRWELEKGDLAEIGGHIGYVTAPAFRRQGIAKQLLEFAFQAYQARGIDRIFITALADNFSSRKTIESVGGLLQDVIDLPDEVVDIPGGKRLARYWVEV